MAKYGTQSFKAAAAANSDHNMCHRWATRGRGLLSWHLRCLKLSEKRYKKQGTYRNRITFSNLTTLITIRILISKTLLWDTGLVALFNFSSTELEKSMCQVVCPSTPFCSRTPPKTGQCPSMFCSFPFNPLYMM